MSLKGRTCEFTLKNPTSLPRLTGTICSVDVQRNRAWVTMPGCTPDGLSRGCTFCVPLRCVSPRGRRP